MASIAISASLQTACSSHRFTKKQQPQARPTRSQGSKQVTPAFILNVEDLKKDLGTVEQQEQLPLHGDDGSKKGDDISSDHGPDKESFALKFINGWWKKGTWDMNMFVKDGKMDWDGLIEAGRAAMVGFFMSYVVDALTGLDIVGQSGNLLCKAGRFVTVISIILLRRTDDFSKLRNLADEATLYDKQWQASWQNQNTTNTGASEKTGN